MSRRQALAGRLNQGGERALLLDCAQYCGLVRPRSCWLLGACLQWSSRASKRASFACLPACSPALCGLGSPKAALGAVVLRIVTLSDLRSTEPWVACRAPASRGERIGCALHLVSTLQLIVTAQVKAWAGRVSANSEGNFTIISKLSG